MFNLQVGQSLISTKHKALIVNVKFVIKRTFQSVPRNSVQMRDYTPFSCGLLRKSPAICNCNGLIAAIDNKSDSLDAIYDDFVRIVKWHNNCSIPKCKVSMRERDPTYITPHIKLLLHRRNKLRWAG